MDEEHTPSPKDVRSVKLPRTALDTPLVARRLVQMMQAVADGRLVPTPSQAKKANLSRLQSALHRDASSQFVEQGLNWHQKAILVVIAAVLIGMLIYPPFHAQLPAGAVLNLGYSWIFEPPTAPHPYKHLVGTVNVGMLITQWLGVLLVGGILVLFIRK